jgi:signal transduction histidine kinase
MILSDFLTQNKNEIIQLCRDKVLAAGESKPTSTLLERGLPFFYDELIEVLKRAGSLAFIDLIKQDGEAAVHGKESLRLGYTISQVVHAYGAVCQSITEFVQAKSYQITPLEFQTLNLALDCAIAEAVTEFEKTQSENVARSESERLGSLIHELGNSLAAASISSDLIQSGRVASAGKTSDVLRGALKRMRHILDVSLTEIRLRTKAPLEAEQIRLIDIISEIEAVTMIMYETKKIHLEFHIDPSIELTADRHLVFSALSNLVNNAMKFTKRNGRVFVRGKESAGRILIEVEDECGGWQEEDNVEELFDPFVQKGEDKSGLGLGLSLSRKAIELNRGKLTAHNIPGKGCVFTIDLPKIEK